MEIVIFLAFLQLLADMGVVATEDLVVVVMKVGEVEDLEFLDREITEEGVVNRVITDMLEEIGQMVVVLLAVEEVQEVVVAAEKHRVFLKTTPFMVEEMIEPEVAMVDLEHQVQLLVVP
jgi:hypothetical protein